MLRMGWNDIMVEELLLCFVYLFVRRIARGGSGGVCLALHRMEWN
jgi:hypothetical protein